MDVAVAPAVGSSSRSRTTGGSGLEGLGRSTTASPFLGAVARIFGISSRCVSLATGPSLTGVTVRPAAADADQRR